jgi:uncharacterized protein (TIGR02466 family)
MEKIKGSLKGNEIFEQENNLNIKDVKSTKLKREFWYPTPIFYKDLENGDEINKKLIKEITTWKKQDQKGIVRSNVLGWHSQVNMHNKSEFNIITKEIFKMQEEIFGMEDFDKNTEPVCDNMWVNVNVKNAHNRNHIHPGAHWSGVYYVQSPPDSGKIWFTDPRGEPYANPSLYRDMLERYPHQWREVYYNPIPGRIIMFPGWLTHEVEANRTKLKGINSWRISISFNFKQMFKGVKSLLPEGMISKYVTATDIA